MRLSIDGTDCGHARPRGTRTAAPAPANRSARPEPKRKQLRNRNAAQQTRIRDAQRRVGYSIPGESGRRLDVSARSRFHSGCAPCSSPPSAVTARSASASPRWHCSRRKRLEAPDFARAQLVQLVAAYRTSPGTRDDSQEVAGEALRSRARGHARSFAAWHLTSVSAHRRIAGARSEGRASAPRALACPTYAGLAALRQAVDGGGAPRFESSGRGEHGRADVPAARLASPRGRRHALRRPGQRAGLPPRLPRRARGLGAARGGRHADVARRRRAGGPAQSQGQSQSVAPAARQVARRRRARGGAAPPARRPAERRRRDARRARRRRLAGGGRHSARRLPRQPELPRVSGARRVGTHRAAEPAGTLARGAAARRPGAASGTDDGTRASLSRSRSDGRGGAARAVERAGRYGPTCRSGGVLRPIRRAVAARIRRDSRRRAAATGGTHPGAARDRGCRGRRHGIVRGGPGARACRAPPALSEGRGP